MFQHMLEQLPPPMQVHIMICGGQVTQAIHAVAELRLADLVQDGPKSTPQLAEATGMDEVNLYRLLRTLVCLGIFSEPEPGYVAPTVLSACLQSDSPRTLYHLALMAGRGWQWKVLERSLYSLQTGKPAFEHLYGKNPYQYFAEDDPEAGALFQRAMKNLAGPEDELIAEAYDFSSIQTLVDVGGGLGNFLVTALLHNQTMKGILFDHPSVIEQAKEQIAQVGLDDRIELRAGNFFKEVPKGGDAYFIKQILHNWGDEECTTILQNCRQAMNPNGKILVAEHVLQPGKGDLLGKLVDLQLMSTIPGRAREEVEFRKLFAATNLTLTRIIPTQSAFKILEGVVA